MEALARLHAEYATRGVTIVAVSLDPTMTLKDLAQAKADLQGGDHIWCIDPTGQAPLAYATLPGFEILAIIDRAGGLSYQGQMPLRYEQLASEVDRAL